MSSSRDRGLAGSVVVTGGASGIGRAAALRCAQAGAGVAVLDIDAEAAQRVAGAARDQGAPAAVGLACDVREEAAVATAVASASAEVGTLRGLVCCAGIFRAGLVHEAPMDEWLDVLNTNLMGTVHACKYVLAEMVAQTEGGSIVCTSSHWAQVTAPGGGSAYCASKGGVSALVRSLALDYAPHSVRVNAIVPGATETPMMWQGLSPQEISAMRASIGEKLALGRMGQPEDVAEGIVWLLSDSAAYVTGSHLTVDGGLTAKASIDE